MTQKFNPFYHAECAGLGIGFANAVRDYLKNIKSKDKFIQKTGIECLENALKIYDRMMSEVKGREKQNAWKIPKR